MKNFRTYYNAYSIDGCRDTGIEVIPKVLPPLIPHNSQLHKAVTEFFAGNNIFSEEINTVNGFYYKATTRLTRCNSEKNIERYLKRGLKELGYEYTYISVKRTECISRTVKRKNYDYEIIILISW